MGKHPTPTPEVPEGLSPLGVIAANFARLEALARADTTVGAPRAVGDRTVIPLAEVYYGGGFGLGGGSAPAPSRSPGSGMGGGGGFGGRARPVAVIDIGPGGVRVRPVFDLTAIGLALVTVVLAALLRLARRGG